MSEEVAMKKAVRFGITAIAMGVLSATFAIAQSVTYNFMPGTNFSKYTTYKWVNIDNGEQVNQIVSQEIQQAVNSQLQAKGLTLSTGDDATLYVGYQIAIQQQRQWNAYGMGGGLRWGGMGSATSSTIDNGSLVIDMYDPTTKQLVWTGTATKTLDPSSNQEKNMKNLDKAMAKLLKNYPPKQ
jgi:hypothetical protein